MLYVAKPLNEYYTGNKITRTHFIVGYIVTFLEVHFSLLTTLTDYRREGYCS